MISRLLQCAFSLYLGLLLLTPLSAQELGKRKEALPTESPVIQVDLSKLEPLYPLPSRASAGELPGDDVSGECSPAEVKSFELRSAAPPELRSVEEESEDPEEQEGSQGKPTNSQGERANVEGTKGRRRVIQPSDPGDDGEEIGDSESNTDSSKRVAQPMGGSELVVKLNQGSNQSYGSRLKGIVNEGGNQAALDIFTTSLNSNGGLARVYFRIYDSNVAGSAGPQIQQAKEAGLRVLATASGTPEDLSEAEIGRDYVGAIPAYARRVPTDPQAWADRLVSKLEQLPVLPDYIEIGNEPDRMESWDGSLEDYLNLYHASVIAINARFPEIKVGGMGLALAESPIGESREKPALVSLVDYANEEGLDLDFLSWHNYGLASQMRYSGIVEQLRTSLADSGRLDAELFVSEWNIRPNARETNVDFDGAHAAANFVSFAATSADLGLDGNCFFMLLDVNEQAGVTDLSGQAVGALTAHGIKKPVFHAMEFVDQSSDAELLQVEIPTNEYALGGLATMVRADFREPQLRLILANDVVEPQWIFQKACEEKGLKPGEVLRRIFPGMPSLEFLPQETLVANFQILAGKSSAEWEAMGFTQTERSILSDSIDRALKAVEVGSKPRKVSVRLEGAEDVIVDGVSRFDDSHNSLLQARERLLPQLNQLESLAQLNSVNAVCDRLAANGINVPGRDAIQDGSDLFNSLQNLGLSEPIQSQISATFKKTLDEERLGGFNTINADFPQREDAESAGIQIDSDTLSLAMAPNSIIVIDLTIPGIQEIQPGKERGETDSEVFSSDWLLGLVLAIALLILVFRLNKKPEEE